MSKNVLVFPFHDPEGKFQKLLLENIPKLKTIFSEICLGVTEKTYIKQQAFLDQLAKQGAQVLNFAPNTNIGDHYRAALQFGYDKSLSDTIFFSFIDRILFALNSEFAQEFTADVSQNTLGITNFERTDYAWTTHPQNYAEFEKTINRLGSYFTGRKLELATCGFLVKKVHIPVLLQNSTANSYSAASEWLFTAELNHIPIAQKLCNWLAWEDPFIENIPHNQLKIIRENSSDENIKRIDMNIGIAQIFMDSKFHPLLERQAKAITLPAANSPVVIKLLKENYLAAIKNSPGSKIYQNIFATVNGVKKDLSIAGELSCANFVSSITTLYGLSKSTHATVKSTVKDLLSFGWYESDQPFPGSVLIWEEKEENNESHQHIGFYLGEEIAISNSSKEKVPISHHWQFDGKRKVLQILVHPEIIETRVELKMS